MPDPARLLGALRANAIFSAISAVLLVLTAPWVAQQLGLTAALPVYLAGALLVIFAARLGSIVRSARIRAWEVTGIIAGDLVWVVASVVLVALYYESLTLTGLLLVDAVAVAVLYFAIRQLLALRALRATSP